jgi:hypothetical protein
MKFLRLAVLPLTLLIGLYTNAYAAEEKVEIKSKDGNTEVKMKVQRKGDRYVGISDGREYVLRGDRVTTIRDDGEYYVTGRVVEGNTFETTELRPVVVHEHRTSVEQPVIHEREVIREKDDPFIKVGPLRIGN